MVIKCGQVLRTVTDFGSHVKNLIRIHAYIYTCIHTNIFTY